MRRHRWLVFVVPAVVVLLLALVALWLLIAGGGHAPTSSVASPVTTAMMHEPARIARGEYLTTVGDCAGCHTAQGGARFAGGRVIPTPFGNITAPNITPDRATGLGDWSFQDFWRALHAGHGRHGELLYPAFPYTSYTKVDRDDALAMFAYLQSLPALHQLAAAPSLEFPYSLRRSLVAWRALYFHEGEFRNDPAQSVEWNRGAYLVQGLGHCNECHATRGSLGGLAGGQHLSGGEIPVQDWYAPDLSTREHGGLQGWSEQDIVDLLETGQSAKGAAFGPMAAVVAGSTQYMTGDDLRAVATYLRSLPPRAVTAESSRAFVPKAVLADGEKIYAKQCAGCHGKRGEGVAGVYPPLDGNSAVTEPSGINATRMVLLGGFPPVTAGNPRPYSMPPFAQQLDDSDVSAVVTYIRQSWSNQAAPVHPEQVARYRHTPID
jgi:mono/diheme cytochrome c family protein